MENEIEKNVLNWLLEEKDIGVRYLAMRDLLHAGADELRPVQEAAHRDGPIGEILARMNPEGYWEKPGHGYNPKYTSTVWSVITLAQLGASADVDTRVATAIDYVLENSLIGSGHFTVNGLPSGTVDCLQGNYCAALLDLGCPVERLEGAFEWMARSVTGDGVAPMSDKKAPVRYYSGKIGPDFACGANDKMPCAWGGVKVMLAFGRLPEARRTPLIEAAIKRGIDFLLGTDPADAEYPHAYAAKPSGNWWKFGFPVFYITDLLQNVEALVQLGYGGDSRLARALELVRDKRDTAGRWCLEYDYKGKIWCDFGAKKQPNKWVTLRALKVLQSLSE